MSTEPDDRSDDRIEDVIQRYRSELVAEADVSRGDLDELEEHLRSLTDELRERGMPAMEAVTEAAHRLGEPRQLAREHASARPAFGAPLSRMRARSAAALLACGIATLAWGMLPSHLWSRHGVELGVEAFLIVALLRGVSWARPVLLGVMAFSLLMTTAYVVLWPETNPPVWLVWNLGIVVFLMPWRRNELTPAGAALALQVWGYASAAFSLGFHVTAPGGWDLVAPTAQVALVAAILGTAGGVLRARWAAFAALATSLSLLVGWSQLVELTFRFEHPALFRAHVLGLAGSGVVASAGAAVLYWRTARSSLGSVASVPRPVRQTH